MSGGDGVGNCDSSTQQQELQRCVLFRVKPTYCIEYYKLYAIICCVYTIHICCVVRENIVRLVVGEWLARSLPYTSYRADRLLADKFVGITRKYALQSCIFHWLLWRTRHISIVSVWLSVARCECVCGQTHCAVCVRVWVYVYRTFKITESTNTLKHVKCRFLLFILHHTQRTGRFACP